MKDTKILIRRALESDLDEMQLLFIESIRVICCNDYSEAQIRVWTSAIENSNRWLKKLNTQYFLIAQIEEKIVGFASLEGGDFDFLYVHKDFQRQGIAQVLLNEIEKQALINGRKVINSYVSITAKPFFEKNKYSEVRTNENILGGVKIVNYSMTKNL